MLPWLAPLRDEGAGHRAARCPHPHRVQRPRRLLVQPRGVDGLARATRRPHVRLSDARAGRLLRRQRHGHRGGRAVRRPAVAVRPARPARRSAGRGRAHARPRRPRASSSTRARSSSRSTPPSWRRCSRSPTSGACRCSCTRAAGSRRSDATRSRPPSAIPGMRLILAHAGICDLAWIWRAAPDHPNLFFDTSWWSPSDLLALFALVAPGQILMASDAPYGSPPWFAAVMNPRATLCRSGSTRSRRAACWAARSAHPW